MSLFRFSAAVFAAAATLFAQKPFEHWPGAAYDARVPTFRAVLGYDPGDQITPHAGILHYLEALASATPRIKVFTYGESWEGRKLVYAAVGSETNIGRLPVIRAAIQKLADPRLTSAAEARKIMTGLPALIWLSYGAHGNEVSSPDAALLTAYHLLAARNDKVAEGILANAVVLICPNQNPDGRERFIQYFEQTRGVEPDGSPIAAEHNQPWPGGRGNHYLFDLNRDWLTLTQPEIRDQAKALREWLPLVYVDLHEMGSDSSYFFAPDPDPYNPHIAREQRESLNLFGRNNAKWFDKYGFDYFTRDMFDAFFPGYGASWPSYYGAVSMTYEQASARGLAVRRADATTLHFRDCVQRHFIASISSAETAAIHREKLLSDFYRYRASAIEEGRTEAVREYILPRGRDASATDKLVALLVEHGIEVRRAAGPFTAGDREYAAGSYVVSMAQPAKRLARTLLDPDTPMDAPFLRLEEERRQRRQRSEIYDVTAWSLPLLYNVEAVARPEASKGRFEPLRAARIPPGELKGGKATLAYLAPWGSQAAGRLLAAALRQDLRVHTSDKPLALNGSKFPSGALIFKVKENPPDLGERLARLARETGADVRATNTGWVEEGVNLGSRYVHLVRKPNILLAWSEPTRADAAGATRFVLERQFGYPVTVVRTDLIGSSDLTRFHVLILPPGSGYGQTLGEAGVDRIKAWVEAGGVLIATGDAVAFLAGKRMAMLDIAAESAYRNGEAKKAPAKEDGAPSGRLIESETEYAKAILAEREPPDHSTGALVRARILPDHWLSAGLGESVTAMVVGRAIYTPLKIDKGHNVAYFDAPEKLLAGGLLWPEAKKQFAYKPLVVVQPSGRGLVIGFTADPNFRASMDGLSILFLNAVFRGPAHARPPAVE
jgi:hypothetical protein